jgi:hypothetical protein
MNKNDNNNTYNNDNIDNIDNNNDNNNTYNNDNINNNIKKIAFCFLTYDLIVRYDIWNNFFKGVDENKYSVFIHPKQKVNVNNILTKELYTFKYNYIKYPIITKSKTDISIVKATIQLLNEALLSDTNITHFIFLSQSCIPIYIFENIYNNIIGFNNSIISCIQGNKVERYNNLNIMMKKYISQKLFFKQQPNMILIRNDVLNFIKNNYTEYFKDLECPDEHYFINIMINIFRTKFIMKQTTFCNPDLNKTQALEFNNIDNIFLNKIRKLGFLFMRKVTLKTIVTSEIFNV